GTIRGSKSEVRIMKRTNDATKTRKHEKDRLGFVVSRFRAYLFGAAMLSMAVPTAAATTAIKAGRLVDASGKVVINAVIVVEGDRIVSIGTDAPPAGAEVLDLSRYSVIPGLIDLH